MQWTDRIRHVKIILVVAAVLIAVASLVVSDSLVRELKAEERNKMEVWAEAMRSLNMADETTDLNLVLKVINENNTIPVIVTGAHGDVQTFRNVKLDGKTLADSLQQAGTLAKRLLAEGLEQLNERIRDLAAAPLFIDDTPSISVYELRSKVRRLVRNAGVKLIIIDYLQLMTGPPELRGMREQEVSNISRSLKAIAKEMSIPVIALSQLSRDVEKRGGNKIPQLSDLRESGAIEQDADIVMFIHRPDYYGTEEEGAVPGQAQIIIAKHRNGSTDVVPMIFRKNEARFVDSNDGGFLPPEDDVEEYQGVESSMNNSEFEQDF